MGALGSRIGHPGKISKIIPAGESKAGLPAEAQQASTAVVPFKPAGPPEVAAVAPEKPPIFDFNTIEGHPDKKLVDLYWKAWPSIIQIETTRSKGNYFATGFIVSDKGHVATAFHAIADADRVVLSRADGGKVEAKLEAVDPGADLAIFKIDNTRMRRNPQTGRMEYRTEPTEALPLAAGDPSPGQSVVNLGYARNVENVGLASGKVSKIVDGTVQINGLPAPVHSDQAIIQTSVACRPGFSGGPLLNESGEVVGLHSAGNGVDRGFDIPTSAITSNLFDRELRKDPEFWRGIVPLIKSAQRSPQTTTRIEPDGGFASDLSNIYAGQHSQVFKIKAVRGKSKGSPTVKDAANSSTEEIELGTALKVTDQHHYVTSAKLVKGASAIRLNDNGIWSRDLEIAKILDDSQLAILRPVGSLYFGSRNPIQLSELLSNSRSMSTVKQGQTLVAIGYPQKQFELHAAVGQLSHFESANLSNPTNRSRRTASQSSLPVGNLNIPLDPGLEGAPIFNRKGELVGIGTTGPLGDKKESMISLPTRSLVEALREITAGKK